jgi:succinyl-diaminopimelate desuccinylase
MDLVEEAPVLTLLQQLIRAGSQNPPGDTREVVAVVKRFLDEVDVPYEVHALVEEKPNLLASLGSDSAGPTLVLHAHLDTVPAGDQRGWSVDPFAGVIEGEKIYGRGAGDDKGSAAAMCGALALLAQAPIDLAGRVGIALVADEESSGTAGTRWLREDGLLRPDFLVVGEQTRNHVSAAERVACGIDLTIFGKSAHGAMPWEGENAVLKCARVLIWLQEHLLPQFERHRHPYLPPATLNVGRIEGGLRWNVVPERCRVKMDRRLLPGETRAAAMQEIEQALRRYAREVEPLDFELHSEGEVAPNVDTPPDSPFVELAQDCLKSAAGEARPLSGYMHTSDGRFFAGDGIPIIHFGPGDPALAHASDEYVHIREIVEAVRFYVLFAVRWAKTVAALDQGG